MIQQTLYRFIYLVISLHCRLWIENIKKLKIRSLSRSAALSIRYA